MISWANRPALDLFGVSSSKQLKELDLSQFPQLSADNLEEHQNFKNNGIHYIYEIWTFQWKNKATEVAVYCQDIISHNNEEVYTFECAAPFLLDTKVQQAEIKSLQEKKAELRKDLELTKAVQDLFLPKDEVTQKNHGRYTEK